MNNARRKILKDAAEKLRNIISDVEYVRDEEQSAFDNLPENFQMSDRGVQMEENISALEEVVDILTDALSEYESAVEDI